MRVLPALLTLVFAATAAHAQAVYAGTGPGSYIAVGVTASAYDSDYGKTLLGGGTAYLDANLYRRIGVEAEVRYLNLHQQDGAHQNTYLVGPKISSNGRNWRPYGKFLIGRGHFTFPFNYAQGSYFAIAPGAGLDWRPAHAQRLLIRLVDAEYQVWPGFTFGPLHPFGVSAGASIRIF